MHEEFEDLIASFYRRARSKSEAEAALKEHCQGMLTQVPAMLETFRDFPAYAAMAFYGAFQFKDKRAVGRLAEGNPMGEDCIARLREQKALKVAASAHPAWQFLLANDQTVLWHAVRLNAGLKAPGLNKPTSSAYKEFTGEEFEDGEEEMDSETRENDEENED
jgi:hypothetical protein